MVDIVLVASATELCSDSSALSDTVVPLLWATNVLTRWRSVAPVPAVVRTSSARLTMPFG
jgi:hypothetical protein